MKFSLFSVLSFSIIAVTASPLKDEDQHEPKYIIADLSKQEFNLTQSPFVKRGNIDTPLLNQINYYQIDMEVGNPPQKLAALLDTGSSDLWFFGPTAGQNNVATFDASRSQSYHNNHTNFRINYVSGAAKGSWGTDDVSIGGAKISQQSFAVVTQGNGLNGLPGLVGVGVPALESTNQGFGYRLTYSNVPASLYEQGHIDSPTFSLFLNNVNAQQGAVLFGAIDHSKYRGTLYTVPRVSNTRYNIQLDSITADGNNFGGCEVNLDSGTTLGSLPDDILANLASRIGISFNDHFGAYVATAGSYNPDTQVVFTFSGVQFTVRLEDLLIDSEKLGPPVPPGIKIFAFSPSSSSAGQIIFGDIFLRNFYVVYDLNNMQIGIALADFSGRQSEIESIPANSGFPRSVQVGGYTQASQKNRPSNNVFGTLINWYQRNSPFANLLRGGRNRN